MKGVIPKRIILVALILGLAGLNAGWDIVSGLFENRISLNFSVLLIPISIGLLRGSNNARRWAEGSFILTYFCLAVALLFVLFAKSDNYQWSGRSLDATSSHMIGLAAVAGFLLITIIFHRLLRSRKSLEFFRPSREKNERLADASFTLDSTWSPAPGGFESSKRS